MIVVVIQPWRNIHFGLELESQSFLEVHWPNRFILWDLSRGDLTIGHGEHHGLSKVLLELSWYLYKRNQILEVTRGVWWFSPQRLQIGIMRHVDLKVHILRSANSIKALCLGHLGFMMNWIHTSSSSGRRSSLQLVTPGREAGTSSSFILTNLGFLTAKKKLSESLETDLWAK